MSTINFGIRNWDGTDGEIDIMSLQLMKPYKYMDRWRVYIKADIQCFARSLDKVIEFKTEQTAQDYIIEIMTAINILRNRLNENNSKIILH